MTGSLNSQLAEISMLRVPTCTWLVGKNADGLQQSGEAFGEVFGPLTGGRQFGCPGR
jgi:hypothetical protein